MTKRRKRILKILLFVSLQVALTLLLAEIAVRVLAASNENIRQLSFNQRLAGKYQNVSDLKQLLTWSSRGFKPLHVVGDFKTNSMGLRTREYSVEKDPEAYRVVALGDSFTFASGRVPFSKHWSSVFGARLRQELRVPAEVINLGYPGVGPLFELRMLQLEASRLEPDLIVLAFYVGNDFIDGQLPVGADTPIKLLAEYSYLARVVKNLYKYKQSEATLAASLDQSSEADAAAREIPIGGIEIFGYEHRYDSNVPSMAVNAFNNITARKLRFLNSPRLDLEFERVSKILLEIRDNATRTGAEFVMIIIPTEFQVDREVALEGARVLSTELSAYDLDRPQELFAPFCKDAKIDCIDLLPPLRRAGANQKLYRLQNTHWNVEGNAIAVDELMSWAQENVDPEPFADVRFDVVELHDLDRDGVADPEDACPGTVIPENVPRTALRRLHFALTDTDLSFDTKRKRSPVSFTTADTQGCSCEQILRALRKWTPKNVKGCSLDTMQGWASRFQRQPVAVASPSSRRPS